MALAETYPAASSLPNGDCGRPRARPGGNRVTVVLGAQWGDEGKGKVVDLLAQDADIVCRCQVRRRAARGKPGPGGCWCPGTRTQSRHPLAKMRNGGRSGIPDLQPRVKRGVALEEKVGWRGAFEGCAVPGELQFASGDRCSARD
ncbi:hypothetical protein P7K49_035363 [Saguinus oedipus]|uniref:Adenylosuccinate synthetase n=1 Tax=Saguinus oedipus TaxID=9490 RepID=A0ABQ9TMF2_SAGOE|nr:hypothetical protein P7K49_035363 [Saguinus oedipus]